MSLGNFSGVSLFRTYIGGDLDCDADDFNGDTPLSAVELTVAGDAHFHRGFVTDGVVDFRLAHLRWYLWLHILAGWIITPLLFVGLARLLRE
ncbi:MAG: hypothetical protein ACREQX_16775 [Candidatus Binataceae bacterium]